MSGLKPGPIPEMPKKISKAGRKRDPLAPRPLDFSNGVRGRYYERVQQGTNIAIIAPDLLDTFPDSEAVNEALRSLKQIAERTRKRTS